MERMLKFFCYLLLLCITFIAGCGGGGGAGNTATGGAVIPATTKVLDSGTIAKLAGTSTDMSTLNFSETSSQLATVKQGDVIVSGITEKTPQGMLRKVASLQQKPDGTTTVLTAPAALEEAVQEGEFSMSRKLGPADVVSPGTAARVGKTAAAEVNLGSFDISIDNVVLHDSDGNSSTSGDQITANGFIRLDPSIELSGKIKDFKLERFYFSAKGVETSKITINAAVPFPDLNKRFLIKELDLGTQTIWIGSFPLVVNVNLAVYVGIKGDVSLGVSAGATQKATFTTGVKFENSAWSPVKEFNNEYGVIQPQLSAAASVRCYAGPELSLKFYGVAGPYANINGYLLLEASPLSTPWWELWCGIEANAGAKLEIEGANVSWLFKDFNVNMRYEVNLLDYKESLAHASTPYVRTGTLSGSVKDAVTSTALGGVSVTAASQGNTIASATTGTDGLYSLPVPAGSGYNVTFTKTGYMSANYNDIAVDADTTKYLEAVLQIDTAHSGTGTVTGKAINAFDGSAISGATIKLRQGINATTGSLVASTTTQTSGTYSFSGLNAGNYTGEASKTGYNTAYFTVTCIGGITTGNQNASMRIILPAGQTWIELKWGATPADLDSHLTGPLSGGTRFHIYYPYATITGSGNPWPSYVKLDLDDTSSYGPETTTIYQQTSGVYRFSVHDYSNAGYSQSYDLSNSNAVVRVYRGSSLIASFNVPANRGGTLWTVFEMNSNAITPINTMSYEADSSRVQKLISGSQPTTDASLIMNLPAKSKK
jgi:carboxypeptidase family protein